MEAYRGFIGLRPHPRCEMSVALMMGLLSVMKNVQKRKMVGNNYSDFATI